MSTSELIISIVALLAIAAALLGWHYVIVCRNRIDQLARLLPGCCPMCGGGGASGEESTGGKCWDCQGTGHPHLGRCAMPWDRARVRR